MAAERLADEGQSCCAMPRLAAPRRPGQKTQICILRIGIGDDDLIVFGSAAHRHVHPRRAGTLCGFQGIVDQYAQRLAKRGAGQSFEGKGVVYREIEGDIFSQRIIGLAKEQRGKRRVFQAVDGDGVFVVDARAPMRHIIVVIFDLCDIAGKNDAFQPVKQICHIVPVFARAVDNALIGGVFFAERLIVAGERKLTDILPCVGTQKDRKDIIQGICVQLPLKCGDLKGYVRVRCEYKVKVQPPHGQNDEKQYDDHAKAQNTQCIPISISRV